jgi:hypothetical protein
MPILHSPPLAPLEAIGIVASIVTAVAFVVVLIFQVRATRAAVVAAESARSAASAAIDQVQAAEIQADAMRAQAATLRPHVIFDQLEDFEFDDSTWSTGVKILNVGTIPAYNLVAKIEIMRRGGLVGSLVFTTPSDLAPTDSSTFRISKLGDPEISRAFSTPGDDIKLRVTVEYSLVPEEIRTHRSTVGYQLDYDQTHGRFSMWEGAHLDRPLAPETGDR